MTAGTGDGGTDGVEGGTSGAAGSSEGPQTVCVADATTCIDGQVATCNAEGTDFLEMVPCADGQTCLEGACEDQECLAEAAFCSGRTVRQCSDDGLSSEETAVCAADEYCDIERAECVQGVCAPGQPSCDENRATLCNESGSGYVSGGTACAANTTCQAGNCLPQVCPPGEDFCQGQQVKRCADSGLSSEAIATCVNQSCVVSSGVASCTGVCAPAQTQCSGNGVRTCRASDGRWGNTSACAPEAPHCASGTCGAPPSCLGLAATCGASADEGCCTSLLVPGDTFYRSNDTSAPATVSAFRLDKYEVTVGRFRKFVDSIVAGFRPPAGSGKHAHLNAGKGLSNSGPEGGFETGWNSSWNTELPAAKTGWNDLLSCNPPYPTWTASPAAALNERRPINCINWFHAYAFCIWDGGFLPSEAEWNYAAAGGVQQRDYPWSSSPPGDNANLTVYGCYYNGSGVCTGVANIAPVGAIPAGNGRWAHADLSGNVGEWMLDWYQSYVTPCSDCAHVPATVSGRVYRGGNFLYGQQDATTWNRPNNTPGNIYETSGVRCARVP